MKQVLICERCFHKWIGKTKNPKYCPKCKSTEWDHSKINHFVYTDEIEQQIPFVQKIYAQFKDKI